MKRDPVLFRPIPDDEGLPPTCGLSMRLIFEKDFQGEIVSVTEVPEERPKLTQKEFSDAFRESLAGVHDMKVRNAELEQKLFGAMVQCAKKIVEG